MPLPELAVLLAGVEGHLQSGDRRTERLLGRHGHPLRRRPEWDPTVDEDEPADPVRVSLGQPGRDETTHGVAGDDDLVHPGGVQGGGGVIGELDERIRLGQVTGGPPATLVDREHRSIQCLRQAMEGAVVRGDAVQTQNGYAGRAGVPERTGDVPTGDGSRERPLTHRAVHPPSIV